ncbi:olfactory receptor 1361-like [Puma concolor]|uniref:Olfactory receptor 1361-like n=1 Tax=Puma concolor TaxID=9696 RepID=A0A6P6HV53_PUMCO|nr:olfactory receptor 1361-like [Puma concolor]
MDRDNQTTVTEFLLLGLSGQSKQEEILFGLFLWMYLVTIIGNILIILAISCDSHLHTPMYFFLANLSCIDICFSSVTTPKMLLNHILGSKSISYVECMTQIYFFITFINMDGPRRATKIPQSSALADTFVSSSVKQGASGDGGTMTTSHSSREQPGLSRHVSKEDVEKQQWEKKETVQGFSVNL